MSMNVRIDTRYPNLLQKLMLVSSEMQFTNLHRVEFTEFSVSKCLRNSMRLREHIGFVPACKRAWRTRSLPPRSWTTPSCKRGRRQHTTRPRQPASVTIKCHQMVRSEAHTSELQSLMRTSFA